MLTHYMKSSSLSPLDWLMPRTYVRQIFCFPSADPDASAAILRDGLGAVTVDVSYLLAEVISDDDGPRGAVKLSEPNQSLDELFSVRDLSSTLDYAVIKQEHFPPSALSVPEIVPDDTQPPFPDPEPVFRARLTKIRGGFLLCVAVHHQTTDVTGFGALLRVWASHCRTRSSVGAGFNDSWLVRKALLVSSAVPLTMPDLLSVREPVSGAHKSAEQRSQEAPPQNWTTCILWFPQKSLQKLKEAANEHLGSLENHVSWLSTGDVLTALLWSLVIFAEKSSTPSQVPCGEMKSQQKTSTIGLPVNFRSRYNPPLPENYLGAAFGMTAATASIDDLLHLSQSSFLPTNDDKLDPVSSLALAKVAAAVRIALGRVDSELVRNALQYVASQPEIGGLKLGPRHDGISIVSWADEGVYELDWGGIVGYCEAVRLPKMTGKRYPIILPRLPGRVHGDGGGLEVIFSLEKTVMERFLGSSILESFAAVLSCG